MKTRLRRYSFLIFACTAICIIACTAMIYRTPLYDVTDKVQKSAKQFWNRNSDKTILRGNSQFLEGSFRGHRKTNTSDNPVQDNGMKYTSGKSTELCIQRLPGALIIGSAKCGTGALATFLGFHPNIVSCLYPKEPDYFSIYNYRKGLEWYRSIMPCSYSNQITIEKSPQYFMSYDSHHAARIHQFDKNIKLILIVKDPVEKAISTFLMMKANLEIARNISFDEYVIDYRSESGLDMSRGFLHQGKYAKFLMNYIMTFKRSQLHIVDGQVLIEDPAEELSKVEIFLGIPAYFTQRRFKFNEDKSKYCFLTEEGSLECLTPGKGRPHPAINNGVLQKLRTFYRPWNVMFSEAVNMTFNWGY